MTLGGNSTLDFDLGATSSLLSIAGSLTVSGTTALSFTQTGPLAAGYTLATYQQTNATVGNFTLSGATGGYRLQVLPSEMVLGADTWQFATSGSWTDGTKWSFGSSPNGAGITAVVGAATSTPWTITLDGQQTLGALVFTNTASNMAGYTLASGNSGSLVFNNLGGAAQIAVTGGSQTISANVVLGDNLTVTPNTNTTLTISGNIGQSTSAELLTLDGPGKLILGGIDSYTGGTDISAGTLIVASPAALAGGSNLIVGDGALFSMAQPAASTNGQASGGAPLSPAPVPEPGALALAAAATLALLHRRRH